MRSRALSTLRVSAAVGLVLALAMVGFAGSASGSTGKPWWHLSISSRPSNLKAGVGRDEVQEITVDATSGDVLVIEPVSLEEEEETGKETTRDTAFEYDAKPAVVQAALSEIYGMGNVEVTGSCEEPEPVTEPGKTKCGYVVTFTNGQGEQPLKPMDTKLSHLIGLQGQATVTEKTAGKPDGEIVVVASNLGDGPVQGEATPVTIADALPAGLEGVAMAGIAGGNASTPPAPVKCSSASLSCTFEGALPAYEPIEVRVLVRVKPGASPSGEEDTATVAGGGAGAVSASQQLAFGGEPVFGVQSFEVTPEEEGGVLDTQAGSHPFQLTTTVNFDQTAEAEPVAQTKDLSAKLPPGLIGNPTPFAQCTLGQFLHLVSEGDECRPETAVGIATVSFKLNGDQLESVSAPLFNLEPEEGEPARFGFYAAIVPVVLDISVRNGGDYGLTVESRNISQLAGFISAQVTVWGVPGDPRHDNVRGWACLKDTEKGQECEGQKEIDPPPLLSMPTSCAGGPLQGGVEVDSWQRPGGWQSFSLTAAMPEMDGCNRLPFSSSISVAPDGQQASTPTGLTVGIHIPQDSTLDASGLSSSAVKDTTLTLPEGVQISPAGGGGLLACSEGQVGFSGVEAGTGLSLFGAGAVGCPDASKVGTAEVKTPLLPEPLVGAVYLAAQDANPFGSLVAMYLDVEDRKAGVVAKIAGEVELNEATGQIVTVFPNSPQVPFEEAKLHFFGSDRAPLSTPAACGTYTSSASIVPWSGSAPSKSTSTFQITSGPEETPCVSPRPFQPGFEAGTTSVQAGGYSPLTITMSRPDADQQLGKLSVVLPPGVSAGLRGVKLCEEPQAATGQCPAESQIGQVTASAGLGGDPYSVETGKAYITGPYKGDPFGVDVVVPAVAGPFNLGTEVVRSKVDVDPTDAHLTVVSDPFPTILDGIPLQLQHVNVTVNRPGFVFNPTNCEPMQLTGELESAEGATANVQTPFQVTNCAALTFKPVFDVSTSAKTSRVLGASLHATLTLPAGAQGTKANVARVKVSLPKQLPSPLKTLQKACTEKVFAENPSNCPKASRVGEATVSTPVLEGPLSGPAYFVSHGGARYPELIIVLTGEDGVTVQVHGETFISKQGITTATFSTVPDVPFSSFELTLPEREYPALTANGNLCKSTLLMPTEIVAQNGAVIKQSTKITVTGCPKTKKTTHKKKSVKHRAHGKKKR